MKITLLRLSALCFFIIGLEARRTTPFFDAATGITYFKNMHQVQACQLIRANKLRQEKNYPAAASAFQQLLKQKDNPEARAQAAQALQDMHAKDEYRQEDQYAIAEIFQAQFAQAAALETAGDYAAAAKIYQELLDAPFPHLWAQSFAHIQLQRMRVAGLIPSSKL